MHNRNKKLLVARSFIGNRFTCGNKTLLVTIKFGILCNVGLGELPAAYLPSGILKETKLVTSNQRHPKELLVATVQVKRFP